VPINFTLEKRYKEKQKATVDWLSMQLEYYFKLTGS